MVAELTRLIRGSRAAAHEPPALAAGMASSTAVPVVAAHPHGGMNLRGKIVAELASRTHAGAEPPPTFRDMH